MKKTLPAALVLLMISSGAPAFACTAFFASDGTRALAGNNEDYWNPNTKVWFVPAKEGSYGRVYFGFDNFYPQGGMNDQGLFFDGFATAPVKVTRSKHKKRYLGNLMDKAMAECSTVKEVIALFEKYNLQFMERFMIMFADKTGNSAIIEGDEIVRKKGRYQIVTNFYQSKAKPGAYPCERYNIADKMFRENEEISVNFFRSILAACHNEHTSPTLYSNIYDLKKGLVYLYHFHNFENVVVIDLKEELKKGKHSWDLPSLFPKTFAAESFKRRKKKELDGKKAAKRLIPQHVGSLRLARRDHSLGLALHTLAVLSALQERIRWPSGPFHFSMMFSLE